jgi:hypothetical protein
MSKSKLLAVAVAASIGLAPVAASAQRLPPVPVGGSSAAGHVYGLVGCVASIMLAAVDKGNKYKKELTTDEAITCGLAYWFHETTRRR